MILYTKETQTERQGAALSGRRKCASGVLVQAVQSILTLILPSLSATNADDDNTNQYHCQQQSSDGCNQDVRRQDVTLEPPCHVS